MSAKGWLQDFEDEKEDREPEKRPPLSAGMIILSSEAEAASRLGWAMIPRYNSAADQALGIPKFYQLTERVDFSEHTPEQRTEADRLRAASWAHKWGALHPNTHDPVCSVCGDEDTAENRALPCFGPK